MNRVPRSFVLALLVLLGSLRTPAFAHKLSTREAAAVEAAVEAEMERQKLVGVAVGVIRDGRVVHVAGFGMADSRRLRPFTTETVFNWASNSKPVMAVAAMQLVEAGQLDLDASVRKYVPELPDAMQTVTVRHLLCHQSGIPHYTNGRVLPLSSRRFPAEREIDPIVSIHRFGGSPLLFEPGAKTSYSSYAYVLLSGVVQRAGGKPIGEQLAKRIVEPAGMKSLQLDGPTPKPNWTVGYDLRGESVVPVPDTAHFWKHGAGGYKSNIADFARWGEALLDDELLAEKTKAAMWTPQPTNDGKPGTFGLGFVVSGTGRGLKVSHNGSQDETKTRLVLYPNQNHGLVVGTNSHHGDPARISTAVYRALAD